MFDWNDLKYFLAVARNGSTLAAAKALGVSQSTVHRRLVELEGQLGRELLHRHPSGYRLTELGEDMRQYAEHVEESVVTFQRHLTACDTEIKGIVRVTCPVVVGPRLLGSSLIESFQSRFRGLRVELAMSDHVLDLSKGDADIAIRANAPRDDRLFGRKIADVPWALYASAVYIERHGHITNLNQLEDHAVVLLDSDLDTLPAMQWIRSAAPKAVVAARSSGLPGLVMAAKSGVGVAPLPVLIGDSESQLTRVLGPIPNMSTPFYLLMHQDFRRTPRVRALYDFLIAEVKTIRAILTGGVTGH